MKNKGVAVIICFFAGGFGLHKFYLGQNFAGILYLLFCWTLIPGLLSFFELFMLIFMSEGEFNFKFNHRMSQGSTVNNIMSGYSGGAVSAKDATSALMDLKKLYEAGVITAEEYEEKRQKLLKSL